MSIFSFFSSPSERTPRTAPKKKKLNSLRFESLEDRSVPSATPADVAPPTASAQPLAQTLTKTVNFAQTPTDFALQGALDQFDPSLGTLQSIDISHAGSITSEIKVENTSTTSTSHISGTVAGDLTLQGPGGLDDDLKLSQNAGSFDAAKYDGTTDYQGPSGTSFGVKTANGTDNLTLNSQLAAYIGTGQVTLTENGVATSSATGGGNLNVQMTSAGQATVTVVYHYLKQNGVVSGFVYHDANDDGTFQAAENPIPGVTVTLTGKDANGNAVNQTATTDTSGAYSFSGLNSGTYTVTETQPAGWIDGKTTAGSLGGNVSDNVIAQIPLPQNGDSINNNFGELKGSGLSGTVYYDAAGKGAFQQGDPGIPGVTLTLTGTDAGGNTVNQTATTDPSGKYAFENLLPGTYTVSETQPAGYSEGTNTVGSQGGAITGDQISNIQIPDATEASGYNFGEVKTDDLAITKTVNETTAKFGDKLIYTIDVTNNGPNDAAGVTVTDTLPADLTYVSNAAQPGWTASLNGNVLTWTSPTLAAGARAEFTVIATAPSKVESVTNPADVTSQTPDSNPNNNHAQVTTNIVAPQADLAVVKSVNETTAQFGDTLVYTINVANNGPDAAQGVTVTDTLPADETYVSNSFASAFAPWTTNVNGNVLTWTTPTLAAGGTAQFTVTARAPSKADTLVNPADVTSQTPDPNPTNNHSQVVTNVVAPQADLGIVKTVDKTVAGYGDQLTYTLTVTNNGTSTAIDPVVTDTLPADVTYQSFTTAPGWIANLNGGVMTFGGTSLAPGASAVFTLTVKAPGVNDTVTNTANVTSNTPDNNPSNNFSQATTTIQGTPGTLNKQDIAPLQTHTQPTGAANPVVSKYNLFTDTATMPQAATVDPATAQLQTFVDGVYQTLTGAAATPDQVQAGVAQLQAGTSRQEFVYDIMNSSAHLTGVVNNIYQGILNRAPTAQELASGVQQLTGAPAIGLEQQLLTSAEFQQLHPSASTMATGLYQTILGTAPSGAQSQALVQSLDAQPLGNAVQALLNSPAALSATVNSTYQAMLRRQATAAELQYWSSQLASGATSVEGMAETLLASQEFYQLAYNSRVS